MLILYAAVKTAVTSTVATAMIMLATVCFLLSELLKHKHLSGVLLMLYQVEK